MNGISFVKETVGEVILNKQIFLLWRELLVSAKLDYQVASLSCFSLPGELKEIPPLLSLSDLSKQFLLVNKKLKKA